MLTFVTGDMFDTAADVRVNAVNCVGVMGSGIALEFKRRYPAMFVDYRRACSAGELRSGKLHVYKKGAEWIINFPTKRHWRDPSRYDEIEAGLWALNAYLKTAGRSLRVTVPALGCGHGGLGWERVAPRIAFHLGTLDAQIFVFGPFEGGAK